MLCRKCIGEETRHYLASALVMAFCGAMVIYILDGKVRIEPRP
ncbi:hypothetical protein [Metapseudomonas resinovorans]|nr:hypothetical protein [Pseudomonas resinovorans]